MDYGIQHGLILVGKDMCNLFLSIFVYTILFIRFPLLLNIQHVCTLKYTAYSLKGAMFSF